MSWVNLNDLYATKSELATKVPTSRTINGKALSSNVTLAASDIKLSDSTTLQSAWDSISPETLSPTLNVTKNGGHIYAQRCGNIVHVSFFADLNDLPPNGSKKLIMSGLPKAICRTTGFIAAQYENYVGYFFADTDGCLYLENKSNYNDAHWVVGNITYFTND